VVEKEELKTGKWCNDFENNSKAKRFEIKKCYMWYTT
jgi:hypothetical protein